MLHRLSFQNKVFISGTFNPFDLVLLKKNYVDFLSGTILFVFTLLLLSETRLLRLQDTGVFLPPIT